MESIEGVCQWEVFAEDQSGLSPRSSAPRGSGQENKNAVCLASLFALNMKIPSSSDKTTATVASMLIGLAAARLPGTSCISSVFFSGIF